MVARLGVNAATHLLVPLLAYPAADDQRFLPNVTGDSAGSALLLFFTLVGHDQSTCADYRDLGSIGRESTSQVWRFDTVKLRRANGLARRIRLQLFMSRSTYLSELQCRMRTAAIRAAVPGLARAMLSDQGALSERRLCRWILSGSKDRKWPNCA